jgi:hypothetical protein
MFIALFEGQNVLFPSGECPGDQPIITGEILEK